MPVKKPKIKIPKIESKSKIKAFKSVNSKIPNRVVRFFNKRLVEKYIDIKQPKKLDVLFGVICNEMLSVNKKYPAPEANLRKQLLIQVVNDLFEIKFRFSALERKKFNRYNEENIEPEVRMRKLRVSLLLQKYWPKLKTSKEFEKINKETFNKEVIEEYLGKYYIYGKDADTF